MKQITLFAIVLVIFIVVLTFEDVKAWRGGCSYTRWYWKTEYYFYSQCRPGWTHNGDENCNIPVCRPTCQNGGTCISPNTCKCPSTSRGPVCGDLTCSYQLPCYPGDCTGGTDCTCEPGFISQNRSDGCIIFDSSHTKLRPIVGKSNVTLSHIRRADNRVDFMFILEGLEEKDPGKLEIIWSNQKRFNNLRFEYVTYFVPPENLPERPTYVRESGIGIVESIIEANVSKIPRDGGRIRDTPDGSFKIYKCQSGFSRDNPEKELATCEINDEQFSTLIEHGDWLNIKFMSTSGGFQKLVNIDQQSKPYATKYYKGLQDVREVQFNFDFIAPKHCSETDASKRCKPESDILRIEEEFTKNPISMYWSGWTDELSGVLEYYVEVFKLTPDAYNKLVEMEPLSPVFNTTIPHRKYRKNMKYPEYRPTEPGMYSVLVEIRDTANNSRIARRLVLFDDQSEITFNERPNGKLYVSSAVEETGYKWQTVAKGQDVTFEVSWKNYFINKIMEENMLLNSVDPYPTQFKEIEDDGVLFSKKYVHDSLDDHEGKRTRDAITNFHGIVEFEWAKVLTKDEDEPKVGWTTVSPLEEQTSFTSKLDDGSRMRVWVRATDVMGNIKTDSTIVTVDGSNPKISKQLGDDHKFEANVKHATYNYTSRIRFTAKDDNSGVHKIGFAITIKTSGKADRIVYEGFAPANMKNTTDDPLCDIIENKCFIANQKLELDNCWFMISKSDLETSTASVEVTAYNQALLTASTTFDVGHVKHLEGLEKYSGPENIRIESPTPNGFRVAWDLPEKLSCYGRAEIVIVLLKKTASEEIKLETYYTPGTSKYFDILGLDAVTDYQINFALKMPDAAAEQETGLNLNVKTPAPETASVDVGLIVGIVVGVLVPVIIAFLVIIFLIRRRYIRPAQQIQNVRRAVSRKIRSSMHGDLDNSKPSGSRSRNVAYDNRDDDLYIYGGMDMEVPQIWHVDRNDITFESLIKSGHFANIYKARLKRGKGSEDVVVAKTLKERFTPEDALLMKAKINFTGDKVGDHPNILRFIGAVVSDDAMGPFIIYEYCENGTMRDYLVDRKNNITLDLQENLFRFGLDIAKGMEYLAGKGIVHRRLAARNILLTFHNEVKISGFGPQPSEEDGGDADKGKRERIPIKWVAPECMESTRDATEQSDVWSYAVVLWEIFSLGDTPYTGKGTDLPKRLKKGERLAKPEQCDDTWYAVMRKCWSYDARKRQTFSDIRQQLDDLFVESPGDDYYFYKR
ncbi:uncharacterized protein LOC123562440 isoform X2 [Mercenaria mercenaria]|uniref:uncharacterized protein LOC123562440 isoform X2 n=1 Tax=Mercenaria mercenaria TaxID=6596 RepID=UPI00234F9DC1|nr:uncharacterized protein LOC123562440 isoform X2 [Mercenaria mercenaria]